MSVTIDDARSWIGKQRSNPNWIKDCGLAADCTIYLGKPMTEDVYGMWNSRATVLAMGTCEAARKFLNERKNGLIPGDAKIVIHNFADQKLVGGYFNKRTSGAQEENLCSNTGLYGVLLSHSAGHDRLYQEAKPYNTKQLNSQFIPMLYSPDVPIAMVPGFVDNYEKVDILTAAAMNIRNDDNKPAGYDYLLTQQIESMFNFVAKESAGKEVYFITGAWGCGVFRNKPRDVYSRMKQYIDQHGTMNNSMHLVLAIPSGVNLTEAYDVFDNL